MATRRLTTTRRIFAGPVLGLLCAAGFAVGTTNAPQVHASRLNNTPGYAINPQPLPPRTFR